MGSIRDDVLANVDIVDVVSRFVQLKRVGRNFVGLSPFRAEKTPSFTVSPEKQIFKCFSTGIGGNVITFLMEMEKIDYWDAIQILAKDAGLDMTRYEQKKTPQQQEKREKQGEEKEKRKRMMRLTQEYFAAGLAASPMAQKYVHEKRKLPDDIIKTRGVGYAPDSSLGLVQSLLQKGFTQEDCLSIGLARKKEGRDIYAFYRNRITFPIYDHIGTLVGFGARAINPDDQPKYLNSSDSPLYDKSKILYGLSVAKAHISTFEKIVVVEGYMDVLAFARLGYPLAVATSGTSLTTQHVKLLKRYTSHIYFLFDNDPAGSQASLRALKIAYQYDIYPKMLTLPAEYKDVDERANTTPSDEDIKAFFTAAEDGFLCVMHREHKRHDMKNPVERKIFLQAMFDILLPIQDITTVTRYIQELAKKVGISSDVLIAQFKNYMKTQSISLAHMRKEHQEAHASKDTLTDTDRFQAFFYKNFLQDNGIEGDPGVDTLLLTVVDIAGRIGDEPLLAVISGDVPEDKTILLQQAQLRRERHRDTLTGEKKIQDITYHAKAYLQRALQYIIKIPSLSAQEKQALIKTIQAL